MVSTAVTGAGAVSGSRVSGAYRMERSNQIQLVIDKCATQGWHTFFSLFFHNILHGLFFFGLPDRPAFAEGSAAVPLAIDFSLPGGCSVRDFLRSRSPSSFPNSSTGEIGAGAWASPDKGDDG